MNIDDENEHLHDELPGEGALNMAREISDILLSLDEREMSLGPIVPSKIAFTRNIQSYFRDIFEANQAYVKRLIDMAVRAGSRDNFYRDFPTEAMHSVWEAQKQRLFQKAFTFLSLEDIYRKSRNEGIDSKELILAHISSLKPRDLKDKPFDVSLLLPQHKVHPTLRHRNMKTKENIGFAILDLQSVTRSVLDNPLTWHVASEVASAAGKAPTNNYSNAIMELSLMNITRAARKAKAAARAAKRNINKVTSIASPAPPSPLSEVASQEIQDMQETFTNDIMDEDLQVTAATAEVTLPLHRDQTEISVVVAATPLSVHSMECDDVESDILTALLESDDEEDPQPVAFIAVRSVVALVDQGVELDFDQDFDQDQTDESTTSITPTPSPHRSSLTADAAAVVTDPFAGMSGLSESDEHESVAATNNAEECEESESDEEEVEVEEEQAADVIAQPVYEAVARRRHRANAPNKKRRELSYVTENVETSTTPATAAAAAAAVSRHIPASPTTSEQTWDAHVYDGNGKLCHRNRVTGAYACGAQKAFNLKISKLFESDQLIVASVLKGDLLHGMLEPQQIFADFLEIHEDQPATAIINGAAAFTNVDTNIQLLDNLRTSTSVTFRDYRDDSTGNIEEVLDRILTYLRDSNRIDPDAKAVNAKGLPGCEILRKEYGLTDQISHTDYPAEDYVSFSSTLTSAEKREQYDPDCDGGAALFINPTAEPDWIRKSNGKLICLPPYSFMLMSGACEHHGTENFRSLCGIVKLFVYIDPPGYNRYEDLKNIKREVSDSVYPLGIPRLVVRETDEPYCVVYNPGLYPYLCDGCTKTECKKSFLHYSYPCCTACLRDRFGIQLCVNDRVRMRSCTIPNSDKKFITTRESIYGAFNMSRRLDCGEVLAVPVEGNCMTAKMYRRKHPHLQGLMLDAIFVVDNLRQYGEQRYLDCLEIRSYVAYFQQSNRKELCNVELFFDYTHNRLALRMLTDLAMDGEFILFNPALLEESLHNFFITYNKAMSNTLYSGRTLQRIASCDEVDERESIATGLDLNDSVSVDETSEYMMDVEVRGGNAQVVTPEPSQSIRPQDSNSMDCNEQQYHVDEEYQWLVRQEREKTKFSFNDLERIVCDVSSTFGNMGLAFSRLTSDLLAELRKICDEPVML